MYEIYQYETSNNYNIRRTSDFYTTGCCATLQDCLEAEFTYCSVYARYRFETAYNCKYLFSVPSLEALEQDYPELFI